MPKITDTQIVVLVNDVESKRCSACKEVKSLTDFFNLSSTKTGKSYECKECNLGHPVKYTYYNAAQNVLGPTPSEGEVAIYHLRNIADGTVFYTGQTINPVQRHKDHVLSFGRDIELCVVQLVPEAEATYWEAKSLVTLVESGCDIVNIRTPYNRSRSG